MIDRASLTSQMHRAGLRLDDSALAADLAVRALRSVRNALILAAAMPPPKGAGLSVRQIAAVMRMPHSTVFKVLSTADHSILKLIEDALSTYTDASGHLAPTTSPHADKP